MIYIYIYIHIYQDAFALLASSQLFDKSGTSSVLASCAYNWLHANFIGCVIFRLKYKKVGVLPIRIV